MGNALKATEINCFAMRVMYPAVLFDCLYISSSLRNIMTGKSTKSSFISVFLAFMDSFLHEDYKDGNTVKVINSGP